MTPIFLSIYYNSFLKLNPCTNWNRAFTSRRCNKLRFSQKFFWKRIEKINFGGSSFCEIKSLTRSIDLFFFVWTNFRESINLGYSVGTCSQVLFGKPFCATINLTIEVCFICYVLSVLFWKDVFQFFNFSVAHVTRIYDLINFGQVL